MENKPICNVDSIGNKKWTLNGIFHREDGPAIEYNNGHKEWWVNSKCHRLDGPAIEFADGGSVWYFHGIHVSRVITKWAEENEIDLDNLTEVDKALIKIVWS